MVTICTTSLTFNNSTFYPHNVFMCFVWISEQTAIISLYNINWLVFITDTQCVYCAVRTEPLHLNQVCHNRPLTAESRVRFQFSWYVMYGRQNDTTTLLNFSPVTTSPPMPHTPLHLHIALTKVTKGRSMWTHKKGMLFRKSGNLRLKCIFAWFLERQ